MLRVLLLPIAPLYLCFSFLRNKFYDMGFRHPYHPKSCIISVGNLSVGGTGKTPFVQFILSNILKTIKPKSIAVLSRGYKRKTKGFQIVETHSSPIHSGDEPLQIKKRFPDILVSVCENRTKGINKLQEMISSPQKIILLDDGFQRREIKKDLDILLTTYTHPFFKDRLIPMGNLRESSCGKKRADIIIVTKCPSDIGEKEKTEIKNKINIKQTPILFSQTGYGENIVSIENTQSLGRLKYLSVLLVSGIANAKDFENYIAKFSKKIKHLRFKDHHPYSLKDIAHIKKLFTKSKYDFLVTTEKDFIRLLPYQKELPMIYYLPINVKMSPEDNNTLKHFIIKRINDKKKSLLRE